MIRALVIAMVVLAGCKKADDNKLRAPQADLMGTTKMGVATKDGRRVEVTANADGYTPSKIIGAPRERLVLVFTRTIEADCLAKLKTPSGEVVDLPLNKPVDVAVTVPETGEVAFACGMGMFRGTVAVATGS
jgi:plastocyanin domain-containing protein